MKDLSTINLKPNNLEEALETIGQLAKIIVELKEENTRLKEQLNTNSKNSSLPPSRDLKKQKQTKPKSNRNRGGQPGHKAHQRTLVDMAAVDKAVICTPPSHCECGSTLGFYTKLPPMLPADKKRQNR